MIPQVFTTGVYYQCFQLDRAEVMAEWGHDLWKLACPKQKAAGFARRKKRMPGASSRWDPLCDQSAGLPWKRIILMLSVVTRPGLPEAVMERVLPGMREHLVAHSQGNDKNDQQDNKTSTNQENVMHLLVCYLFSGFLALATARNSREALAMFKTFEN